MYNTIHLKYVRKVVSRIHCSRSTKNQIMEDLLVALAGKSEESADRDPVEIMGPPDRVASEFIENMGLSESPGFEYKSSTEIFGLPLVHVNTLGSGYAKGIIAIGRVAVGVISIGAVALGILSFGAFSLGLAAAIGAVTFSGLTSIGAVALSGFLSIGAVAISGHTAIGAYADAKIAIGTVARGKLAVFTEQGYGDVVLQTPVDKNYFTETVRSIFPKMKEGMIRFYLSILR